MAAEEAERLGHKHVGTEHLLLGILARRKMFWRRDLMERGLRLSTLREDGWAGATSGEKGDGRARPKSDFACSQSFSRGPDASGRRRSLDSLVGTWKAKWNA